MIPLPWPPGSATGVGSHPGGDVAEALRVVLGELPDLPYLPELPGRGPGADLLGRGAALLVEMAVELQPSGWRLVDRPGRDLRRARGHLTGDLDALEEHALGFTGPLKIQAAGPWTLAAGVELTYGDKVLADPGAVRDLIASLAEGLVGYVAEVRRRVPGARILIQLDEPSLPAVLAGTVPIASGFGNLPAVEEVVVEGGLRTVVDAVSSESSDAFPLVHCCAPRAPVALLRAAGAKAISLDVGLLARPGVDPGGERSAAQLAEAIEAGVGLFAGVVPTSDAHVGGREPSDPRATVEPMRELWNRLGFGKDRLGSVVLTPTCGLAGASESYARAALARCRTAARLLAEEGYE
ncbi:MAG: methionine synthase [Streptosporangiales bacterium]|nr:methionine synthase [Streptosporangiales bacterium]